MSHANRASRTARPLAWLLIAAATVPGCLPGQPKLDLQTREEHWSDGRLKKTLTFYVDDEGKEVLHGPQVQCSGYGRKSREVHYRHGVLHGKETQWHVDGAESVKGRWENGAETGVWTEWGPLGDVTSRRTYRNGRIVGKQIYWEQGRKIREDVHDEQGYWIEVTTWHDNGRVARHGTFKKGNRHGRWTWHDPGGKLIADGEWRDDEPWEGTCSTLVSGEAGSLGGVEELGRYRQGKLVEKLGPLKR